MASIWIDLDHAPHIPFFAPQIEELKRRGHEPLVTVRDYGYTRDLVDQRDIPYELVGKHPGGNSFKKVAGLMSRATALARWSLGRHIDVAVSHGSRALVVASALRRIPCITMYDYEFVSTVIFNRLSRKVFLPDIIPDAILPDLKLSRDQVVKYPGQKEEVYLGSFVPDASLLAELDVTPEQVMVVIRPPASMAHYHNPEADRITQVFIDRIEAADNVVGVCVPRTSGQAEELRGSIRKPDKFRILTTPVNGLNLIWHADLIVGGGGTMNREAALMGVPVYSVFMGRVGAIDQALSDRGRLSLVRDVETAAKVDLVKRPGIAFDEVTTEWQARTTSLVNYICDEILAVAQKNGKG